MANDKAILDRAQERWDEGYQADKDNRERGVEALRFLVGDQWDDQVIKDREGRPVITINKLPQFLRRVVNEQRMARPGIKIRGAGEDADAETARVYEGLIRNIENQSDFETIADDALEKIVSCGFAAWRVLTDYEDDMSFNQEIRIERVKNQYNVIVDPHAQKFDKSDKKWAFIGDTISYDEAEAEFGKDALSYTSWKEVPQTSRKTGWYTKDRLRIAEYFELKPTTKTIALLADGKVIEVPKQVGKKKVNEKEYLAAFAQEAGLTIERTRTVKTHKVMWYKITADDILDRRELAGTIIPVVTAYGDVTQIDGEEVINGLIEFAKDPTRMGNYAVSAFVEGLGIQNKAPYIAADGQVNDYKTEWEQANTKNIPVLRYKPMASVPPPQRQNPPVGSQGYAALQQVMDDALRSTTGIYDPQLGQRSNETSGVAIAQRQQQGEIGTFHYGDNLMRAMKLTGRICVEQIPVVYDTPRIIRILGQDGDDEMVPINQPHPTIKDKDGKPYIFDLSRGKYDLVVEAGASFNTRREEFVNLLIQLIQGNPALMNLTGDKLFNNMDIAGAEELAERFKKLLPPEIMGDDEVMTDNQGLAVNSPQQQLPPELMTQGNPYGNFQ